MNRHFRLIGAIAVSCSISIAAGDIGSTTGSSSPQAGTTPLVGLTPTAGSIQPDKIESFSVLQKKYLKTVVITNLIYAAGFSLYRGVAIPRYREAEGAEETMKLMPLTVLSEAMMFVSLPMSVRTSYKARTNYRRFYKESPRNFTMPILFAGVACAVGATGLNYWQMFKDYRDNNEIDGSYNKYSDLTWGLLDAGTITWIGTNLYSLAYIAGLGNKAAKETPPKVSFQVAPLRIGGANGLTVLCEF